MEPLAGQVLLLRGSVSSAGFWATILEKAAKFENLGGAHQQNLAKLVWNDCKLHEIGQVLQIWLHVGPGLNGQQLARLQ